LLGAIDVVVIVVLRVWRVSLLEIDKKNKNEEDQTNHRGTRILTRKTLQCEGKNQGHQPATTFTIFVECL
jgi:hypothetical protein